MNWWTRKLHRWGALITAVPLLLVILTGLLLQVKKQVPWVQPTTRSGSSGGPSLAWDQALSIARGVSEAGVESWQDISRIDLQPKRGVLKLICRSGWEIQLDHQTGEVLSVAIRRSDWIESLHDGSFFSDPVKLGVFLPSGIILLILWGTGAWLWWLPFQARINKRKRMALRAAGSAASGES